MLLFIFYLFSLPVSVHQKVLENLAYSFCLGGIALALHWPRIAD